ncbi:hypothetical protein ACRASX_11375 [Flavobacterium sp. TMP13]|uniref:hypothetical protein n=1 Tax=unclassified Flavobacterium TaxID=196869 RepID=UPI00076D1A40|nr:hypothetical protein [Flavobacterium sp. TAB 87]KVV15275.1 hypothetical protein AP058_01377 [Flavobacterium sp. TAB 87]
MVKFWIISIVIYIISTYLLSKFTLKANRREVGERIWRFGSGRSTYWRILTLCSFGITVVVMLVLHWIGIVIT